MALIDYVTAADATGRAREFLEERAGRYAGVREDKGRSLYTELRLHNPAVIRAQHEYLESLLDSGPIDEALFEVVMVAVAQANDCAYCAGSHRENLALLLDMDDDTIRRVADGDYGGLPERARAVARFAEACIDDPHRLDEADLDRLFDAGFDEAGLIQLLAVIGYCDSANLVVDSLNAHPADLDREFRY